MKKKLKIVLKQDVENLGLFGETKEVAAGFARNFLIPKGLALYLKDPASKQILKRAEEVRKEKDTEIERAKEIAKKLDSILLVFKAKAGEKGKLFGSVGPKEIVAKIYKDYKIKLDEKQIEMELVKEIGVGEREVVAKLGYNIESRFKIKVEPEKKESVVKKEKKKSKSKSNK